MPGRAAVYRSYQIGKETVAGTPVAANKKLPTLGFTISRTLETKQYRAFGFKPNTATKIVKDFGGATMAGPLSFSEMVYPLSSFVNPAITTPVGGTNSRQWKFSPSSVAADAFNTFTLQEGDADAALQMAYSFLVDLSINITLDDCQVNGNWMGRSPTAATLSGGPTTITQIAVGPREIDLFMDPTFGGIGTTKVTDLLDFSAQFNNKQAMKWVLNTSFTSFKDTVEMVPNLSAQFTTEHNAQSRTLYAGITANPRQYFRMLATGPIIEAALPYSTQMDIACDVTATELKDVDGVYGYQYTILPVYDVGFLLPW